MAKIDLTALLAEAEAAEAAEKAAEDPLDALMARRGGAA